MYNSVDSMIFSAWILSSKDHSVSHCWAQREPAKLCASYPFASCVSRIDFICHSYQHIFWGNAKKNQQVMKTPK